MEFQAREEKGREAAQVPQEESDIAKEVERSKVLHIQRTKSFSPGSKPFQWQVWPTCDKQLEAEKLGQEIQQHLFEQSPAF